MDQQTYDKKMAKIKLFVKITLICSLILSLAMIILLIVYNFAGVFYIKTLPGTKYENGYTYPGWQSIYYGCGEMIIQGYTEFGFDIYTFMGFWVAFLALIVCSIIYLKNIKKRGTNKKKAILEFVCAGCVLVGAIVLFLCDKFTIIGAKNVSGAYASYYDEYLSKALNGELEFKKTMYPYLILIVGIVVALVKAFNGWLLLHQKKVAIDFKKGENK